MSRMRHPAPIISWDSDKSLKYQAFLGYFDLTYWVLCALGLNSGRRCVKPAGCLARSRGHLLDGSAHLLDPRLPAPRWVHLWDPKSASSRGGFPKVRRRPAVKYGTPWLPLSPRARGLVVATRLSRTSTDHRHHWHVQGACTGLLVRVCEVDVIASKHFESAGTSGVDVLDFVLGGLELWSERAIGVDAGEDSAGGCLVAFAATAFEVLELEGGFGGVCHGVSCWQGLRTMGCAAFCGVGLWGTSGSIEKSCCMALWWLSGALGCVLWGRFAVFAVVAARSWLGCCWRGAVVSAVVSGVASAKLE